MLKKDALPTDPQAGRPAGPQASSRAQGPARLPQHRAPLAQLRRCSRRTEVQVPAPGQAGARRHRRHLRIGRRVRPLHADARVPRSRTSSRRCGRSCSSTASTRSPTSSRRPTTSRRRSTGSTRRPTSSGLTGTPTTATHSRCSGRSGARTSAEVDRPAARRRPQQLSRQPVLGREADVETRHGMCTG